MTSTLFLLFLFCCCFILFVCCGYLAAHRSNGHSKKVGIFGSLLDRTNYLHAPYELPMSKRLTAFLPLVCALVCHAQADSTTPYNAAINNAIKTYQRFRGTESNLYIGPALEQSNFAGKGSPYFGTGDWFTGSVFYDGTLYENVMLKYDLVLDQLVVLNPNTRNAFYLFRPRVDDFYLGERFFVNLKKEKNKSAPAEGFYEQLTDGPITLLRKYTKSYQENFFAGNIEQRYDEKNRFYALKDETYHEVSNAASLYALCGNYGKQIKDGLKKQNLASDNNTEQIFRAIAQQYNQLAK